MTSRRLLAFSAIVVVGAIGVVGIGLVLWSGLLDAIVTADGDRPNGDVSIIVMFAAVAVLGLAGKLGALVVEWAGDDFDPVSDALMVFVALWALGVLVLAIWIALRVTGVVDHGLIWADGL